MIKVYGDIQSIRYSIYHLVKAFLPDQEVIQLPASQWKKWTPDRVVVVEKVSSGESGEEESTVIASYGAGGGSSPDKNSAEREIYDQLSSLTGRELPWGVLTGVRPVKLASAVLDKMDREQFTDHIFKERKVSRIKAGLCYDVAENERRVIRNALGGLDRDYDSYSLYIGIPVCPSICSYCSFSCGPISVWKDHMDGYVDALINEIGFTAKLMGDGQLTSIYIGGGTPTVLTEPQLERLCDGIACACDPGSVREYTLEAGRPDTITAGKLSIAKSYGVTRLSVNPQSMQQKTLDAIGRKHTVEQVVEAFAMAREQGFDNINMDIIAGLQGEDASDMEMTLERIKKLAPDSLTVHSLAIKRAAKLTRQSAASDVITDMINLGAMAADQMGMKPYYLYRQKSIAGNHENIGYALPGREGIYNIMIMEEVQSIMACGAGASSKLMIRDAVQNPDRAEGVMTNLLRQENVKSISEYIDRIEEMKVQKEKLFDNISSS